MKSLVTILMLFIFLFIIPQSFFSQENFNCQLIGAITNGPTEDVVVKNDIAYFGNGTNLSVVDFSDPANPVEIIKESIDGIVIDLELYGDNVYSASNNKNILIFDITQPLNSPLEIAEITGSVPLFDLELQNNILYVLNWKGFKFYDVNDPANPVLLAEKDVERNYKHFSISGNYAYAVAFNDSLYVWEMSDLNNTALVKIQPVEINTSNITVNGNYAYVTSPFGLKVVDITDPLNPSVLSSYSQGGMDFVVDNNQGYLCMGANYVHLFDVTDPANLIYINSISTEGPARHSAAENGKIYVAEDYQGVSITDVSDLNNPQLLGRFDTWGRSTDVITDGNYLYIANGNDGLRILDITDPENPAPIGLVNVNGNLGYLDKFDNEIYSCENTYKKLNIIDVSNPSLPVVTTVCNINSFMNDIAVNDSLIFISSRDSGLVIYRRSDCTSKLGSYSTGVSVWSALPRNNLLYLIDGNKIFYVLDISDPANPVELGNVVLQSTSLKMDIVGDTVFVASYYGGLTAVDVSDSQNPQVIGSYNEGFSEMRDVKVNNGFAYVANGYHGLAVLDVTNIDSIYLAANYNTSFSARSIDVKNNMAFLADDNGGIYIIRNDASTNITDKSEHFPVNFNLSQNYPNPFNPETVIKYSIFAGATNIQASVNVSLKIFDVLGREVATLVSGKQTAGEYSVTFNTNLVNRELPSGIYFYKLRANDYIQVRKMVLLK